MQFKRIGKEDKELIESFTKPWGIENADYSFTTLYLWGRHGKITYAIEDDALFLLYRFPESVPFPVPYPRTKMRITGSWSIRRFPFLKRWAWRTPACARSPRRLENSSKRAGRR